MNAFNGEIQNADPNMSKIITEIQVQIVFCNTMSLENALKHQRRMQENVINTFSTSVL